MSNAHGVRRLGGSALSVSPIGLGCLSMSDFYGEEAERDERQSIATIHRALDLGLNFLDTADMYGRGANEELVGRAIRDRRERAVVGTKFGVVVSDRAGGSQFDGSPAYVQAACEASLKRLGIEAIDLYTMHRLDPQTPIEETVGAMARLVEQGKVKAIGVSEVSSAILRRACAVHPIAALQTEYSLWSRDPEDAVLPACRELGVALVAYSPLGRGFLAGKLNDASQLPEGDYRRTTPRFQGENFTANLRAVERLRQIAHRKGCSPAQLSLAWVLAQGVDVVPIPGTKRIAYLEENWGAVALHLDAGDLAEIDQALPRGFAAGLRYPEAALRRMQAE